MISTREGNMKSLIAFLLVASSLSVFADEVVYSNIPRVETIYGMSYVNGAVQIQVESNGCTSKDSFVVQKYIDPSDNSVRLLFIRNRPDWCRGFFAEGVGVEFSREDLGLSDRDAVRVENPFGPNPRASE